MPGQSHKSSSRDRAKKTLRQMITTRDFWHQKCVSCLFCFGFLSKFLRKKKSAARVFFFPGIFSSKFLTRTRNSLFQMSKTLDHWIDQLFFYELLEMTPLFELLHIFIRSPVSSWKSSLNVRILFVWMIYVNCGNSEKRAWRDYGYFQNTMKCMEVHMCC